MVRSGILVATPFPTSDRPFTKTHTAGELYGLHSTILNPPLKDRTTTVRATHSLTAVTPQSAGCGRKRPVPYHPESFRNRVKSEGKRFPAPFSTTMSFDYGVLNQSRHPFRTINAITLAPSRTPMHERVGFTNAHVTSEIAKRLHKPVYAS